MFSQVPLMSLLSLSISALGQEGGTVCIPGDLRGPAPSLGFATAAVYPLWQGTASPLVSACPHALARPGSLLERCWWLPAAPIPVNWEEQSNRRFERPPQQPSSGFVLDFPLPDAAAQHHPSVAEPLLGRNMLPGVTAGCFKCLFPAPAPALGAPGQIKSSVLLVLLLDQSIINALSSHKCLIFWFFAACFIALGHILLHVIKP